MTWYWITLLVVGHVITGLTIVIVGQRLTRDRTTPAALFAGFCFGYLCVIVTPVYIYEWLDIITKEGFLDFRRKPPQPNQDQSTTTSRKGKSEPIKTDLQL